MKKAKVVPCGSGKDCEEAKKILKNVKEGKGDFIIEERDDHVLVRNICADIKIKNNSHENHLPFSITKQFFIGDIFIVNGYAFKIN